MLVETTMGVSTRLESQFQLDWNLWDNLESSWILIFTVTNYQETPNILLYSSVSKLHGRPWKNNHPFGVY